MIKKEKILIYAPFQGVAEYSFPFVKLSNTLRELNYEVDLLTCRGLQIDSCILQISAHKELNSIKGKKTICNWCREYTSAKEIYFDELLDLDSFSLNIEDQNEINNIVKKFQFKDIESFEIDKIPIARIASYNFLLRFQIIDLNEISEYQFEQFRSFYLKAVLKTFFSYKCFLKQKFYKMVFVGDPHYSQNQIILRLNDLYNVKSIAMFPTHHHKYYFDHYLLCHGSNYEFTQKILSAFTPKEFIYDKKSCDLALAYVESLWNSKQKSIFSTPKNNNLSEILRCCKIKKQQKKIVLLVMSSLDESFATDFSVYNSELWSQYSLLFENQILWIEECIKYFKNRTDTKLIIRCHPREYNEGKTATILEVEKLANKYKHENIYFNFPSDKISVYDLLNISDLCLMRRSSIGIQAGLIGIPAISYVNGNELYPVFFSPTSIEEYFLDISNVLNSENSRKYEYVEIQFKWLIHYYGKSSFKLNSNDYWDLHPKNDDEKEIRKKKNLPVHQIDIYNQLTKVLDLDKKLLENYIKGGGELWDNFDSFNQSSLIEISSFNLVQMLLQAIFYKTINSKKQQSINEQRNLNKSINFYLQIIESKTV
ncbi:MAG: hypothetical protein COB02_03945 [Candidatus Cloacimonadota bacterium]|nr:MAG: hypothetical protein COB02_03945 [Candidatus Cloacimonadota bacterium]